MNNFFFSSQQFSNIINELNKGYAPVKINVSDIIHFRFRGVYVLINYNGKYVYAPRFKSDIFQNNPLFGIEYYNNFYYVKKLDNFRLVLIPNLHIINTISSPMHPVPPAPPNNPKNLTIVPFNPPSSSGYTSYVSNLSVPMSPINNNLKNNVPPNTYFVYNMSSIVIIYNIAHAFNSILSWRNINESIYVSEEIFKKLRMVKIVDQYTNNIKYTSDLFNNTPIFDVKTYYSSSFGKFYKISLLNIIGNIQLSTLFTKYIKIPNNIYYKYIDKYIDDSSSDSSSDSEVKRLKNKKKEKELEKKEKELEKKEKELELEKKEKEKIKKK